MLINWKFLYFYLLFIDMNNAFGLWNSKHKKKQMDLKNLKQINSAEVWNNRNLNNMSVLVIPINEQLNDINRINIQPINKLGFIPKVSGYYKSTDIKWTAPRDDKSNQDRSKLQSHHLGGRAIIFKSFDRIHESNLKKQGLLPLTFVNSVDYDKIQPTDQIKLLGLQQLTPGKPVQCEIRHRDGSFEKITMKHSMNQQQIDWFRTGKTVKSGNRIIIN